MYVVGRVVENAVETVEEVIQRTARYVGKAHRLLLCQFPGSNNFSGKHVFVHTLCEYPTSITRSTINIEIS